MLLRKRTLPRRLIDWICFIIIGILLPLIYVVEIAIILPAIHEIYTFWYNFTFGIAIFLIFNIKGNFLACLLIDTCIDLNVMIVPKNAIELDWHYCTKCNSLVPPRSWHCSICYCCILKRDHHCVFVGCCIGHRNHRYFILFIGYLFIGSTYALLYNSWYLWIINANRYRNYITLIKAICPLLMFSHGSLWHNMPLFIYNINLLAFIYSGILLIYHVPIIIKSGVCYEKSIGSYPYDTGNWLQNLENIFGKRMHLVWLSPLLTSELPNDGTAWCLHFKNALHNKKKI